MAHDVDGFWELVQSNHYRVQLNIEQPRDSHGQLADGKLTGTAQEVTPKGTPQGQTPFQNAQLNGDFFVFSVDWGNGSIGEYSGTFDLLGHLSGVTFDANNVHVQATWVRST